MSKRSFCDDWSCPAGISCAHAFGRSRQYAGGIEGGYTLEARARKADADACAEYRFDVPKLWLAPLIGNAAQVWLPTPIACTTEGAPRG